MEKLQEHTLDTKRFLDVEAFLREERYVVLREEQYVNDIKKIKNLTDNRGKVIFNNKLFECLTLIRNDILCEIMLFPIPVIDLNAKVTEEEYKKACIDYSMNALKSAFGEPLKYTYKVMQFNMLKYQLSTITMHLYGLHSGYMWDFKDYQIILLTSEGKDTTYAGNIVIGFK